MTTYELATLLISVAAALIALVSVPALQPALGRLSPGLVRLTSHVTREFITGSIVFVAILLSGYYLLFYPCPWYKIAQLKRAADGYVAAQQWSFIESIGEQLCDCGEVAEGWDWQAKSLYLSPI
jgi:hypothetical protein